MLRKSMSASIILILLVLVPGMLGTVKALSGYDPTVQTQMLLYNEARTVYLGNLARRDNGVPPLRWNRQLTYAARWFSWDSTENRPAGFVVTRIPKAIGPIIAPSHLVIWAAPGRRTLFVAIYLPRMPFKAG